MSNTASETSLSADIFRYIRYQLRGRRGLIVAAAAVGIPALWVGWPWLVVAGIAPLLIALAPCAIMCGLGLCAMKSCSKSGSGEAGSCSKSRAGDENVVSMTASKLAEGQAEPVAAAIPLQARANSVDDPDGAQPEAAGRPGATIDQEKEKFQ